MSTRKPVGLEDVQRSEEHITLAASSPPKSYPTACYLAIIEGEDCFMPLTRSVPRMGLVGGAYAEKTCWDHAEPQQIQVKF